MRRLTLLSFLAICALTSAQSQSDLDAKLGAISVAVEKYMAERQVTGASVALASKGQIVYQRGFGYADLENDIPYRAHTVNRLASISKTITAVAIMQLVQAGKIDLDEDIRKYAPEFPDKVEKVTARHILTHTSGIRHYKPLEADNTANQPNILSSFGRFSEDPLVHKPGEKFTYSTYAFNVLARAIETASGMSFREYLNVSVFKPAGMADSRLEVQREIVKNRARGYRRLANGDLANSEFADISYKWAGGGMLSTAPDLCRMGMALMQGKLMKPETLTNMWTKQKLSNGSEIDRTLGWEQGDFRGNPVYVHGGSQQGTKTFLVISPRDEVVLAVLTNYEGHNPGQLAAAVRDAWYGPAK